MQGQHLFEYGVIRVVPRVEREEFLNVGVIMLCNPQKFLRCRINLNPTRMTALWSDLDLEVITEHIHSFEKICLGGKDGGPIGMLSLPERFRWLTASRSTMIQTSRVHPGLCIDPSVTFDKLMIEHAL